MPHDRIHRQDTLMFKLIDACGLIALVIALVLLLSWVDSVERRGYCFTKHLCTAEWYARHGENP